MATLHEGGYRFDLEPNVTRTPGALPEPLRHRNRRRPINPKTLMSP